MEKNRGKGYKKNNNRSSSAYRKADVSNSMYRINRKKADKTSLKLSGKRVLWYLFVIILIFVLLMR